MGRGAAHRRVMHKKPVTKKSEPLLGAHLQVLVFIQ
jgi:hypothetical protein